MVRHDDQERAAGVDTGAIMAAPSTQKAPTRGVGAFTCSAQDQNAASSSSMIESSTLSAIARSAASFGSTLRAKKDAAATLPS